MTDYDRDKAKALFDQHVKPVRQSFFLGSEEFRTSGNTGKLHYVITPEMLRVLRYATWGTSFRNSLRHALWNHLKGLDDEAGPDDEWAGVVTPDPRPAWRIAADEAADKGLTFAEVLDAIEKALAK